MIDRCPSLGLHDEGGALRSREVDKIAFSGILSF
jgi:hypothetical protein